MRGVNSTQPAPGAPSSSSKMKSTLSGINGVSKTASHLVRSEEQVIEAKRLLDSLMAKSDIIINKHILPPHLQQFKLEYDTMKMPHQTLKELEEEKIREDERQRLLQEQNDKFNVEHIINNINTSNIYTKLKKISSKKVRTELKNEVIETIMNEGKDYDLSKKYNNIAMVGESKDVSNDDNNMNDNISLQLNYSNSEYYTKINENIKRRAERDMVIVESVKRSSSKEASGVTDNAVNIRIQEEEEKSLVQVKKGISSSSAGGSDSNPSLSPSTATRALLSTQPSFKVPDLIRSSSLNLVESLDEKTSSKSGIVLNNDFKLNKIIPEIVTTKVVEFNTANSPVSPSRPLSSYTKVATQNKLNDVYRADALADSCAPVIITAAINSMATKVSANFDKVLSNYNDEVRQIKITKKKSRKMLDFIRTSSYEDLSIDLDPNFTRKRIFSKGLYLIIFYVNKFKLKSAMERLRIQTAEASKWRIIRAGSELTRIARGFLGRLRMRDEITKMNVRIELEKQRILNHKLYVNRMAARIHHFIFYTGKIRTMRKHIRRKYGAVAIQRRIRGVLGRKYFKEVLGTWEYHNLCVTRIQCAYRCHLARRWVRLLGKVKAVNALFADIDSVEEEKKSWKQIHGAAFVLTRYVRKFIVNRHVRKMIYWHRIECAITIQKYYRRYIARVKYIRVIRATRAENSVYLMAVTVIQKCIRGRTDRKLVAMLKEKKKKEKQERLMRKKELMKWGALYPPRIARSALRSLMPFRYSFEWANAQMIQRYWRGYRYGRRRLYFARIREHIRKYQVRLRIRSNGILKFQALYRGYRYRYGVMRKKRVSNAVMIQCFFRVQRARYELKIMKMQLRAAEVLGRNCRLLIRWRKTKKAREERNKFDRFVRRIQICARKFLGRRLLNSLKNSKRISLENKLSTEDSLNRLLGLIQLRIIQDSIVANLGQKNPLNRSGVTCPCLGPVQALFCVAVGPKARYTTDNKNLITNKLDNNNYRQFILSHNGLTIHGRGSALADKNQAGKNKAKRKGKVLAFSKYAKLFYCIFKGYFRLYNYEKKASPNDVELAFSSARFSAESGQLLTYFEFLECCRILGCKVFDKDGTSKTLPVLDDFNYEFSQNSSHDDIDDYNEQRLNSLMNTRPMNTIYSPSGRDSGGGANNNINRDDSVSRNELLSESADASPRAGLADMPTITIAAPKKKVVNNLWPVRRSMIYHPDYIRKSNVLDPKLTLILKMFITSIDDDWMAEVMEYLDQEAAARLSIYAVKIQNLVRKRKALKIKHLMRLNKDSMRAKGESYICALQIQSIVRLFVSRRRVAHKAQKHFIHYIPIDRDEFWFNPRTRVSHASKPKTLLHYDSVSVLLPAKDLDFIVMCFFCSVQHATVNCFECEESYCRKCFDDMHCKGSRNRHRSYRIPFCSNCRYQHATKSCLTCILQKPKIGSLQETMSESERGTLCDTCFDHLHNASEHVLKKETLRKERTLLSKVQTPLIVSQQIRSKVMTTHKFDSLVQQCDECGQRSAYWRCDDCDGQIYCQVCLIGLHSFGPFVMHKATTLSYYTPESHRNYLDDSIAHRRYNKFEAMKRQTKKQRDIFYELSIVRLQAWWRRVFHGRIGKAQMKAARRQLRRQRAVYIRETIEKRNSLAYQLLDVFGSAPPLRSDSREDRILKCVSPFSRRRAREHIWQNKEDWAWYLDKQEQEQEALEAERKEKEKREKKSQKFKAAGGEEAVVESEEDIERRLLEVQEREAARLRKRRKGDVRKGFDIRVHKDADLEDQARSGGYRLPGAVSCKYAKGQFKTSRNLTYFVRKGQLVRISHQLFRVIAVTMREITLDRRWRGEDGKYVIYRLPYHPSERGRWGYYFKYKAFDYIVKNRIAQTYFGTHAAIMSRIEGAAKAIAQVHRRFDFMIGYTNWMKTAKTFRMRAKWAQSFIGEGKAVAYRDPDAVTIFKVINQATGVNIEKFIPIQTGDNEDSNDDDKQDVDPVTMAYVEKLHDEGGVSRDSLAMSNLEYYNMMQAIARRPKGGNWYATKLELMVRNKREEETDPKELALQANLWEENVDIMTENIYYIHKETREMLNEVPLALATKIRLEEQEREARERDEAIKGVSKQFLKKKGGNSMKKR